MGVDLARISSFSLILARAWVKLMFFAPKVKNHGGGLLFQAGRTDASTAAIKT